MLSTRRFLIPPPKLSEPTPLAVMMPVGTRLLNLELLNNKVFCWAMGRFGDATILVHRKLVVVPNGVPLPLGPDWINASLVGFVTAKQEAAVCFHIFDLGEDASMGAPPPGQTS